jgi:hypothetical protein
MVESPAPGEAGGDANAQAYQFVVSAAFACGGGFGHPCNHSLRAPLRRREDTSPSTA